MRRVTPAGEKKQKKTSSAIFTRLCLYKALAVGSIEPFKKYLPYAVSYRYRNYFGIYIFIPFLLAIADLTHPL